MAKRHSHSKGNLHSLFLRLEELILANSGENEFDEVFKLLIAKLWDEMHCNGLRFAAHMRPEQTFADICSLLAEAYIGWPGVLEETDIQPLLTPEHLQVCVGVMTDYSFADESFATIDAFFEFLVAKDSKGAKGQYFTPRHVIELCVRLLKPTPDESVLDPACGSGGFLIHVLNYMKNEHGLSDSTEIARYCGQKLWGFDIDSRAVRIANALLTLAGHQGSANIFRLNSLAKPEMRLNPEPGDNGEQAGENVRLPLTLSIEDLSRGSIRDAGGFDVIVTNPPFAGEVIEREFLDEYELGRGKRRVERDVLFLERCIQLLKPSGRLAIILPHNKFAANKLAYVRKWLLEQAKVQAVIGLGRNTFLPHTHQKTSILVLQKNAQELEGHRTKNRTNHAVSNGCSNQVSAEDCGRIFFGISERDGKNTKGQFLYRNTAGGKGRTIALGATNSADGDESAWKRIDHDLDAILTAYEGFTHIARPSDHALETNNHRSSPSRCFGLNQGTPSVLCAIKAIGDLEEGFILAPERYHPHRGLSIVNRSNSSYGTYIALRDLVTLVTKTVSPTNAQRGTRCQVLDTSDSFEGIILMPRNQLDLADIGSLKKVIQRDDVIISRLRPYLRQVGLVDAAIAGDEALLLCSTEYFPLRSRDGRSVAFLVPFLLSESVQNILAASQEGGHHPRFSAETLLDLRIPVDIINERDAISSDVAYSVALHRQSESLMAMHRLQIDKVHRR